MRFVTRALATAALSSGPWVTARALSIGTVAASRHSTVGMSEFSHPLPGGILVKEHELSVPLDHEDPSGECLTLFVREVVKAEKQSDKLPYLLFLQGGPGFAAPRVSAPPSGWMKSALEKHRVLLLDQRGTGRSTPATPQHITAMGDPAQQAEYLALFRADAIVKDCELVRSVVAGGEKLSLLGQSYGGFCILSYLSFFPASIERALFTCGLAPVGQPIDDVYRATFRRMEQRNARFYRRYPGDIELVRSLARTLDAAPADLPRGGRLTARRFLQLGLLLGSESGLETLHDLLELARAPGAPDNALPELFLVGVENAQAAFETNPIYWLLHESIYCDGAGSASGWAAERVQASLGPAWDYRTRLAEGDPPIFLSGEMVYSWMGEDYAGLRALKPAAELLARKADWPELYRPSELGTGEARCAALMSYDDIYVERQYSEATAGMLRWCRTWVSNEFQHSGLRDQGARVFEKLLAMAKGEVEY